jgi:hypothetical protein
MRSIVRLICLFVVLSLLSGCTPALYLRLFNATSDVITVTNTRTKNVTTIPPRTAVDISLYDPSERLIIHSSNHVWSYLLRDFYQPHWALSFWEQHAGVMRTYARIDARGRIYVWAPPADGQPAHEIPQPRGFPIQPQKT